MLWLDTETYCEAPITHGTYKYAENCEVDIVAYAVDEDPVEVWDVASGAPMPELLAYLLLDTDEPITAWNAMFDRTALRFGNLQLDIPIERWRCAMVRAMAHGLPGSLDKVGEVLKIEQDFRKIKTGRDLMMLFCKPRPKTSKIRRATRATHPTEWAKYLEYATHDVVAMRECCRKLPQWNMASDYPAPGGEWKPGHTELALWHRDQHANDRGYRIDTELVDAALTATDAAQAKLRVEVQNATDGSVAAATQRDQLLTYLLEEHGVDLPDMQKSTLERRLADPELPECVRELLRIRLEATISSTAKYKALKRAVNQDGRLRGTIQFDGAQRTRRAAGRVFQPQNLPSRGVLPHEEVPDAIEALLGGYADLVYDNVMRVCSSTIRGCLIPAPGKKFVISDLANIEGRDAAWLAGEEWKLQAFREFDNGSGPDLYKVAYAKAFGVPVGEVTKAQRQIGKVLELFMQYEGGVGAFLTGAATYGIDLDEMATGLQGKMPADVVREAEQFYEWRLDMKLGVYGLRHQTFLACDALKRLWRGAHPAISSLWRELSDAAIAATSRPGVTFECRRFKVRRDGAWLRIRLPSGRHLCYPFPEVDDGKLSYMGINQYTKKWQRIGTYGGRLFENACQSFARDVLYDAKPAIEEAGYAQVLEVHDEVVTEVLDAPEFNEPTLSALLATPPAYAPDLPLAAGGFEAYRYGKES